MQQRRRAIVLETALVTALLTFSASCGPPSVGGGKGGKPSRQPHRKSLGEVTTVLRVAGVATGLEQRVAGRWVPAAVGRPLPAGTALRCGKGVRARVKLRGGTLLSLNASTRLVIARERVLRVERGEVYAEVARGKSPLLIVTPAGRLRVVGTKLDVKVARDSTKATVDVSRGRVEVGSGARTLAVGAGERAVLRRGAAPRVGTPGDLAALTRWAREALSTPRAGGSGGAAAGFGSLTARRPGFRGSRRLELRSQDVRVTIRDNVALTQVEQRFFNPTGATLEGTYRFPLPTGASISRLQLQVGKKLEDGEIVERRRARRIFNKIVNDTIRPRDPALLEWVGGRTFRMKIFPIPPHSERRVIISYTQPLAASFGRYRYVYPLAAGSKSTTVGRFSLRVDLSYSRGLRSVRAPLYPVLRETAKGGGVTLRYEASAFRPRASFVVGFQSGAAPELSVASFAASRAGRRAPEPKAKGKAKAAPKQGTGAADAGARGFFSLVLRPELPRGERVTRRDLLLLVDSSYSAKDLFALTRATVQAFVGELDAERTRFNVVACDIRCRRLGRSFRKPDAAGRGAVRRFLAGIKPSGSSDLRRAFAEAAKLARGAHRPHVLYIGDGRPSAGEMRTGKLVARVVRRLRGAGAELSALSIGADANRLFLSAATRRLGGRVFRVSAGGDVPARVLAVASALYRPALTDIHLDFERLDVRDVYPRRLPTLVAGSEVTIVGRFARAGRGVLRVRGRVGGKPFVRRFPITLAASTSSRQQNSFIPRLWAKQHIDALTLADYESNRRRIVKLSKRYTVLSRATALLVLENERMYREFGVRRKRGRLYWKGAKVATKTSRDTPNKQEGKKAPSKAKAKGSASAVSGADAKSADRGAAGASRGSALPRTAAKPGDSTDKEPSAGAGLAPKGASTASAAPRSSSDPSPRAAAQPRATTESKPRASIAPLERRKRSENSGGLDDNDGDASAKKDAAGSAGSTTATRRKAPTPPRRRLAPRKHAKAKKRPMRRRSRRYRAPGHGALDGFGGGGGGGYSYRRTWAWRWVDASRIQRPGRAASRRAAFFGRVARRLANALTRRPHSRALHRAYQRALVRSGNWPAALAHAKRWVALEGRRREALRALGDARAANGETAAAMRTYASMADVTASSRKLHRALAEMYRGKGQLSRSCSHRWALMSLAPRRFNHHVALVRCLSAAGERDLARSVLDELAARRLGRAERRWVASLRAKLERGDLTERRRRRRRRLEVRASWDAPVDLELSLVSAGGLRVGLLGNRRGGVAYDSRDGRRAERLSYNPRNARYRLDISRAGDDGRTVRGTVVVRLGRRARTIRFVLHSGAASLPLASLSVNRRRKLVQVSY